jgi:hypothetical protein
MRRAILSISCLAALLGAPAIFTLLRSALADHKAVALRSPRTHFRAVIHLPSIKLFAF